MKYYFKLVICKKIIQKWVSIYETCECDIGVPNIYKFLQVDEVVNGTPENWGVTIILNYDCKFATTNQLSFNYICKDGH